MPSVSKRERIPQVTEWFLKGFPFTALVALIVKQFEVTERTAARDIAHVRNEVLPRMFPDGESPAILRAEAVGRAERLFATAVAENKLSSAVDLLKWLGELRGLRASQQQAEIVRQLRAELDELKTKQHEAGDAVLVSAARVLLQRDFAPVLAEKIGGE